MQNTTQRPSETNLRKLQGWANHSKAKIYGSHSPCMSANVLTNHSIWVMSSAVERCRWMLSWFEHWHFEFCWCQKRMWCFVSRRLCWKSWNRKNRAKISCERFSQERNIMYKYFKHLLNFEIQHSFLKNFIWTRIQNVFK